MLISKSQSEKGQAMLIIILVMVVVLTVGLSVASRSITNLGNSNDESSSQKAFSAAEAGIETALAGNQAPTGALGGGVISSIAVVTPAPTGNTLLNNGKPVNQDEGIDLWLTAPNTDGSINYPSSTSQSFTIGWSTISGSGNRPDCAVAALEIIILSGTSQNNATATRYAYDPCSDSNNFSSPASSSPVNYTDSNGNTISLQYSSASITVTNGIVARIVPLYANAVIGVQVGSNTSLPAQGKLITSTGTSGQTVRKIQVYQGYPSLDSSLFQYVLYSP